MSSKKKTIEYMRGRLLKLETQRETVLRAMCPVIDRAVAEGEAAGGDDAFADAEVEALRVMSERLSMLATERCVLLDMLRRLES